MVKSFKYIFTRIIIGVGIALILMLLKGGLIANVNAMSVTTIGTANNANIASCQGCNIIDSDLTNYYSGLTNTGAYIHFNVAISSSTNTGALISTLVVSRLKIDNNTYTCSINGISNNNITSAQNPSQTQAIYSLTCPVQFKNTGQIQHLYVQVNGTAPSFLSVYSPFTIVYDDGNQAVVNAIEDNTEAQEETNDTLKDDSVDNDKAESDIDDMKDKVASNGSITQLLTLPITLYQSILNSLNGSCTSFSLGSLYNHNLTLPCINLQNLLGSTLYGIIDILCCGSFILVFRKRMVDIFNHMTSLNDRGNEVE